MKPLKLTSIAEQVAAHLREEIERGTLSEEMPGAKRLAEQLGINHKTVDSASLLLEEQGFLQSQGAGKPRLITRPKGGNAPSLKIAILLYEPEDADYHVIINLRNSLNSAGHTCILAKGSQKELNWDLSKIKREVRKSDADAWVVLAGSREILEWFSTQSFPSIAMHGHFIGLPIASGGASLQPAMLEAVDKMIELGHRRIVMVAQKSDLTPTPGKLYKAFLQRLEDDGIPTSSYNLPIWDSNPGELYRTLDSLFQVTPPTALIITDVVIFFPVYVHLLKKGIRVPEDLSLMLFDNHPQIRWCQPKVAHTDWDDQALNRRILKWANNVASGKEDLKQIFVKGEFVENETIAPPP